MELSDQEFELFQKLTYGLLGIKLHESKRALIVSRLSARLRDLKLESFLEYLYFIKNDPRGDSELINFINRITTNETYFFREDKHFDYLTTTLLPKLVEHKKNEGVTKLRIWSSACSTGEEPYTLAMVIHDYFKGKGGVDLKILATDISTRVLSHAQNGIYLKKDVEEKVPKAFAGKYFTPVSSDEVRVTPELRNLVTFKRLNLLDDRYPIKSHLDVIFCRNVMIYFDDAMKRHVLSMFKNYLASHGHLFVGHSENLFSYADLFTSRHSTIYTKVEK